MIEIMCIKTDLLFSLIRTRRALLVGIVEHRARSWNSTPRGTQFLLSRARSSAIDFGSGLEILFAFFAFPAAQTKGVGVSHFKHRVVAKIGLFDRVFTRRRVVEANKDAHAATFSTSIFLYHFLPLLFVYYYYYYYRYEQVRPLQSAETSLG